MTKLNQELTPIFSTLKDVYAKRDIVPFHVPGHKRGKGVDSEFLEFMGPNPFSIDVTIFKMVDGLHNPKSCIKEAQELAADAYGVKKTFFAVNGTSGAIQAMIMSVVKPGEKILVPRNVHKSVSGGIILSGSLPIYMNPEVDDELGIAHGVKPETVEKMLKQNPDTKAVLIINPTYYGAATDIKRIADIVHSYDIPLIVDEAHGPHLHFHEDLPVSAVDAGADICCQSTHKIIGAMTQMSMLHINSNRVDVNRVQQILSLLHTTSPSYPLMASLDCARRQIATEGRELLSKTIKIATDLRAEINKIPGIFSFGKEIVGRDGIFAFDQTKLSITAKDLGLTGFELETLLVDDYNIQVELSDFYNVLGLITIGDTEESAEKLLVALKDISARFFGKGKTIEGSIKKMPTIPEAVLIPREAFYSEKNKVKFAESEGKICAEMIMAYPPGIPIITPGERISKEIINYVKELKEAKLHVQGMEDPELNYVNVIEEEDAIYLYTEKMKNKMFAVPMNLGANKAGIEFGPEILMEHYPDTFGEMTIIDVEKQRENFNEWNLKYKNTILNTCEKLAASVNEAVRDGYRPITIGGDHSIALGSISGVSLEKEVGVVWIDAHGDMNTDETTISGNIHGMPLALLQGVGDRDLVNCFYEGAKIDSKNVVIIGARDLDVKEREVIEKLGVKVIHYDDIMHKGLENVLDEIKDYLKIDNIHISFDVDSVDPEFAPGVSTPVRSGFTPEEMFQTFKFLFKNYSITSVDIVEFNPVNDKNNKTGDFVNELTEFVLNPNF
ncbi:MAG: aminotransferase class I/II-fold pyridoxal phosphate-dependent enzyme [Cetobacterium sp.]|uniref:aminotransferase class I/II-fold pyridoxal phosphate-dependent enzyme n=1 Tax=unclassified Cetobacterium TaxID=2630983 RepID=UPI00163B63AD|nr:aminotransferase class I/II-fold pyridoxal phosphate-dependent enzyme [Cetobacterium sp. 2A]MBC2856716.1 aminotransferase class I/II-fold pyridoxal phosphate-dependent enzyme [Cetobacterium sp. 2A]